MSSRFNIRSCADGLFFFELQASNGRVLVTSRAFRRKQAVLEALRGFQCASNDSFIYLCSEQSSRGFSFYITNGLGKKVAFSEPYSNRWALKQGIEAAKSNAASARIIDLSDVSPL
ncbi:DUF1508 domain-containing protein [Haliea sp. E1-2-M8]|uniref:DUF1508 domain-containing protein n=1 Tax=Haliea sp. E1-2-M8 TaxID=3064706 RepID=UPI00351CAF38